jgi:hypothetical protein
MSEERNYESAEDMSFSILENIPKTPVAAGSAAAALYFISEIVFSSDMISAIKSSPNIAAVVIAFIAFAAAYTIAKYIAYALEKKDVKRHGEIEAWFYQTQNDIKLLRDEIEIMSGEQEADIDAIEGSLVDIEDSLGELYMAIEGLSFVAEEESVPNDD